MSIHKQSIILKADDLVHDQNGLLSANWSRFLTYLERYGLKAGLGVIGQSLDKGSDGFAEQIRRLQEEEGHELWNHGYDHQLNGVDEQGNRYCEFQHTSYEYQLDHLLRTQRLARERLGLTLRTFGAPGNSIDAGTVDALQAVPEIEVWLFGQPSSKFVLERVVNAEHPVIRPNFAAFREQYTPDREYLVLQLHPNSWNEGDFDQFTRIIDYLLLKPTEFVTPYAYYLKYKERKA
ncbi:MAG: polysaccharide deacetylase [Paenibacillaceae bacterium]|nr:polysaccharide deacetylase [Paenibacillaceae bacterium]